MLIGVPKEIKTHEYRVGLTPASVRELIHHGHQVLVETGAGAGIGFDDKAYAARRRHDRRHRRGGLRQGRDDREGEGAAARRNAGCCARARLLFTYLHLAPDPEQTKGADRVRRTAIAYETVTSARGGLPLLAPMSEVAGRMSIQVGAHCLEKAAGRARHAARRRARRAAGEGGRPRRRRRRHQRGAHGHRAWRPCHGDRHSRSTGSTQLDQQFGAKLNTIYSTVDAIEEQRARAPTW